METDPYHRRRSGGVGNDDGPAGAASGPYVPMDGETRNNRGGPAREEMNGDGTHVTLFVTGGRYLAPLPMHR